MSYLERQLDKLYADLAELRRHVITGTPAIKSDRAIWDDLLDASSQISRRWTGCNAVEEIRAQREK